MVSKRTKSQPKPTKKSKPSTAALKSNQKQEEKDPGGRPSKIDSIDLDHVEKLAERGWTDESIADFFGISRSTLSNYKVRFPKFMDAIKKGKLKSLDRVVMSQYEAAIGYTHPEEKIFCHKGRVIRVQTTKHYPPDIAAGVFLLCNRDKKHWQHVSRIGVEENPDEKLNKLIEAMNAAAKDALKGKQEKPAGDE